MPLFRISAKKLTKVPQTSVLSERVLQRLVEANLDTLFSCRFVASEFSTGSQHAGRIDTLALSEDNNPVIIEYKKVEASDLINQSLFYLSWLSDHRGDYEIAAQKQLGAKTSVDWGGTRVICLAPNYRKYDLHAVQVMGVNIELWTYRVFADDILYIEEVLQRSYAPTSAAPSSKNPVMVAAGKKAALTKLAGAYTFDQHIAGKSPVIREIALAIEEYVMSVRRQLDLPVATIRFAG